LVEPWRDRNCENRSELVAGGNESKHRRLNIGLLGRGVFVAIAKVCYNQLVFEENATISHTFVEGARELEGVDELRVETGGDLNTHAAYEEVEVHPAQIGLLVPWHLVLRNHAGNNGVGSTILNFEETHDVGDREGRSRRNVCKQRRHPDLIPQHYSGSCPQPRLLPQTL
jgi:hypothetical protein